MLNCETNLKLQLPAAIKLTERAVLAISLKLELPVQSRPKLEFGNDLVDFEFPRRLYIVNLYEIPGDKEMHLILPFSFYFAFIFITCYLIWLKPKTKLGKTLIAIFIFLCFANPFELFLANDNNGSCGSGMLFALVSFIIIAFAISAILVIFSLVCLHREEGFLKILGFIGIIILLAEIAVLGSPSYVAAHS